MSVTTCFVVSYVPFVVSVTFVANSVLEVAGRSGVAAAAAAAGHAGQRHHQVLVDVMSPVALAALALFWTLLGVAFYRYAEGCATATPAAAAAPVDNKQPQQTAVVVAAAAAKRSKTKPAKDDGGGPPADADDSAAHSSGAAKTSAKRSAFRSKPPSPPPSPETKCRRTARNVAAAAAAAAAPEPPTNAAPPVPADGTVEGGHDDAGSGGGGGDRNDDDDEENPPETRARRTSLSAKGRAVVRSEAVCRTGDDVVTVEKISIVENGKKPKRATTESDNGNAGNKRRDNQTKGTKEKPAADEDATPPPPPPPPPPTVIVVVPEEEEEEDECDDVGKSKKRSKRSRKRSKKNRQQVSREPAAAVAADDNDDAAATALETSSPPFRPPAAVDRPVAKPAVCKKAVPVPPRPCSSSPPSVLTPPPSPVFRGERSNLMNMDDRDIWYLLCQYVLRINELYAFGFPVNATVPGHAVYYRTNMRQKKLNPVAKEFSLNAARDHRLGSRHKRQRHQQQQNQQQQFSFNDLVSCVRCSSFFSVHDESRFAQPNRCMYHYDRLVIDRCTMSGAFACCDGDQWSQGCTEAACHVWNGFADGHNGPDSGFVETTSGDGRRAAVSNVTFAVYGMDCEMCYTANGLEVTKVTLVDVSGSVVYDSLVKPAGPIIDYNTRFSGITADDFRTRVSKTLGQVQRDLLRYIRGDTVLVGHGLGTDLLVLRIIHYRVVDTCKLFPHPRGEPFKLSLKSLAARLLKRDIQQAYGHDSVEDARAAMDLALYKLRRDMEDNHSASDVGAGATAATAAAMVAAAAAAATAKVAAAATTATTATSAKATANIAAARA